MVSVLKIWTEEAGENEWELMLLQAWKWLQLKPQWVRSFKHLSDTQPVSVRTFPLARNKTWKPMKTGLQTKGSDWLLRPTVQGWLWMASGMAGSRSCCVIKIYLFLHILPLPPWLASCSEAGSHNRVARMATDILIVHRRWTPMFISTTEKTSGLAQVIPYVHHGQITVDKERG